MFALVGLAAAAPQSRSLPAAQDQEAVISTIMSSLQPAIDAAIASALGQNQNSVTTITVEGTYGIPDGSGSFSSVQSNSNYVSEAAYHDTGYPHQHDGNSQQQNSVGLANYGVSNSFSNEKSSYGSGASLVSTAGVNGVVYGENQVSDAVTATNNVNVQNVQTQVQQTEASLSKAAQSQKLVSSVLNALAPSVEAAVQNALMAMMQQNTAAVSTVSTSQTSSSSFSASQEQTLVTKIIEVLTPSIATSVRKALAARFEAEQAAAAQAAAAQLAAQQAAAQQAAAAQLAAEQAAAAQLAAEQQAAAQLAAQQAAAAQLAAEQQAAAQFAAQQAAAQQAAAFAAEQQSQSALIAQIISALKPSIASSVSSALQANSFSQQQQSQSNSFSQQQNSQAFNSQSSSSASSSGLSSIFGDGSAHNVKIETPDYKIEYNN